MSFNYGQTGGYVRPNTLLLKKAFKGSVAFINGEGDDAFVRLRTWDWFGGKPGSPTGKVLPRGELVWRGIPLTSGGVTYRYVSSPRRNIGGWIPQSTLSDLHPLILLARELGGEAKAKTGDPKKFDTKFNEMSCTNGAFKIQNWLRGHIADDGRAKKRAGPLKWLKTETAWADALRTYALKGKYVQYYLKKDKTRLTDPNNPHAWLWPGDIATFSRTRYWDPKKKSLELVPYRKDFVGSTIFEGGNATWHYTWSGHVKTLIHCEYDEGTKRYTKLATLEGHMGGTSGEETEAAVYTIEDFLFRGVYSWGLIPILAKGKSLATMKAAAHKAWDGNFWYYHKLMASDPSQKKPGDARTPAQHETEAKRLLAQAAKRRGLPTPDWATVDSLPHNGSGLECFGFAYWKD